MPRLIQGFMAAGRGLFYCAGRKKRCSAQWAALWPKMTPRTLDQRWSPAQVRASTISWVRSLTLSKWRTASKLLAAPLAEPWMSTSIRLVPSAAAKTSASPVMQPCAPGYSGWLGVTSSGVHVGSGCVSGLPSMSAFLIAVTGPEAQTVSVSAGQGPI
jgi:hypothetical protein